MTELTHQICNNPLCHLVGQLQPIENYHNAKWSKTGKAHRCKNCLNLQHKKQAQKTFNAKRTEGTKTCNKCKETKHVDDFVHNPRAKDGVNYICKECMGTYKKHRNSPVTVEEKVCSTCKKMKKSEEFYRDKGYKSGLTCQCKECMKNYRKRARNHYKENGYCDVKEKICTQCKTLKKIDEFIKHTCSSDGHATWCKACRNAYLREHKRTNINYRISNTLRNRLGVAVKHNFKAGSAVKDLGCSISEFKQYLEERFYSHLETGEAMTWENYGQRRGTPKEGWVFDHIIPLCSFDLTDRSQVLKACHYTNLTPMWASENAAKSSDDLKNHIKHKK